MQVTETLTDGLKREYRVVVPAADLDAKVAERLDQMKGRVQIAGFRPGKVPVAHLRKVYGRAAMAEVIEAAIREANAKIVTDHGFKLASDPKVSIPTEQAEMESLIEGRSDLAYTVAIEIVPKIELADFKGVKLERLVAEVADEEIEKALQTIAEQNKPFAAKAEGAKAERGDRITVSFTGTIDGKLFEGGSSEDIAVHLGSNTFIPGFEDQLIGMAVSERRTVNITFPINYLNDKLAGQAAIFDVRATAVEAAGTVSVDDAFATSLGMESLAKLKDAIKGRLEEEHRNVSRRRLKRALLDDLDKRHKFEPPPSLVEDEFNNVWKTITSDLQAQGRTLADEDTTEEAAKAEYRGIAERRVRLGLVVAEIGERNGITVTDDEITRAIVERARQIPGREQEIWDFYRKNPGAVAAIRAPLFEDKVVDFLLELAEVSERKVARDDLYNEDGEAQATA